MSRFLFQCAKDSLSKSPTRTNLKIFSRSKELNITIARIITITSVLFQTDFLRNLLFIYSLVILLANQRDRNIPRTIPKATAYLIIYDSRAMDERVMKVQTKHGTKSGL